MLQSFCNTLPGASFFCTCLHPNFTAMKLLPASFFVLGICLLSCSVSKPRFDRATVLWTERLSQLDDCESYKEFQTVAGNLGFSLKSDEEKNGTRVLSYTRSVYVAATRKTFTQVLGFWINLYIPRVVFTTSAGVYPAYFRELKEQAVKENFSMVSADEDQYTMMRHSDQVQFSMKSEYKSSTGMFVYTVTL